MIYLFTKETLLSLSVYLLLSSPSKSQWTQHTNCYWWIVFGMKFLNLQDSFNSLVVVYLPRLKMIEMQYQYSILMPKEFRIYHQNRISIRYQHRLKFAAQVLRNLKHLQLFLLLDCVYQQLTLWEQPVLCNGPANNEEGRTAHSQETGFKAATIKRSTPGDLEDAKKFERKRT